jgi:hypothetical protein
MANSSATAPNKNETRTAPIEPFFPGIVPDDAKATPVFSCGIRRRRLSKPDEV